MLLSEIKPKPLQEGDYCICIKKEDMSWKCYSAKVKVNHVGQYNYSCSAGTNYGWFSRNELIKIDFKYYYRCLV